jgi:hypothetical protein
MKNAQQAEEAIKALPFPKRGDYDTKDAWLEARQAYNVAQGKITSEFREWLGYEYASSLPTKIWDRLWAKAWEDGHAHGYHDVEMHYIDMADFAEAVAEFYR